MNNIKINYVLGDFLFKENKVGVQFYYEQLIKRILQKGNFDNKIYAFEKKKGKLLSENIFKKYTKFSNKIIKVLLYFCPIELLLSKDDIYVTDGFVPITIHKCKKIAVVHYISRILYP